MTDYVVVDPAQDNVALSLASVINQANQANADAMSENNLDGDEPVNTNEGGNSEQLSSVSLPFRVDSLILAFFPWITPLPMVSTSLSEVYPLKHFAHVRLLTSLLFFSVIEHIKVIGNRS
jgi:hypothetical protein